MNELWSRLETQLRLHAPELASRLRPGASEAELLAYEAEVGYRMPDDLRQSYLLHDGCDPPEDCASTYNGGGLLGEQQWIPLGVSLHEWRAKSDMFNESDPYFFDDWSDAIIRPWQSPPPSWLPIGKLVGMSERIYADVLPGPRGTAGQVLLEQLGFGRGIEAMTWSAFLTALTDGLEQGSVGMFANEHGRTCWCMVATGWPFRAPGYNSNCP